MTSKSGEKPIVLIDARMVSAFEHGISRYVTDIATGFAELSRELEFRPVFLLDRKETGLADKFPWNQVETLRSPVPFLSVREWIAIPSLIKRVGARAFHSPSFDSFPWMPVPHMMTIHDLIHLKFGSIFHHVYYAWVVKPFARRARVIATVSNAARVELAKWLDVSVNTISVQPNVFKRPAEVGLSGVLERAKLRDKNYFLVVANEKLHKNVEMIRKAHLESGAKTPLVTAKDVLSVVDPERQSATAFEELFRSAKMIVSPSLVEGFGRVAVEAVLARVPALISSIPAHREIFDDLDISGVKFCDPHDFTGWVKAFKENDEASPESVDPILVTAIADRFSLQKLIEPVVESYRKLLQ